MTRDLTQGMGEFAGARLAFGIYSAYLLVPFPHAMAAAATSVAALRALIQQRFPDATPLTGGSQTTEQVATGIGALDQILPNGGLPRGRLSVWAPHGGVTAILRGACQAVVTNGERSAWIDGDN